jgi:hypothetical protein
MPVRSRSVSDADDLHEWVHLDDSDGHTWAFDVTFLTSNYGCIYGRGCPGVFTEPAPELEHGCCTYGAHFTGRDDRERVQARIDELTSAEWQLADVADEQGGPIQQGNDGEWVTRTVDDACIMLNRPDHPGGAGCALHQAALARGERPLDWKPDVCWQLPLHLDDATDDNGHQTFFLREWKRRDWGEGGFEFAWWCTDDPLAFAADRPVWKSMRDEILELVGEEPYEQFVDYVAAKDPETLLPHPQVRRRTSG